MRLLVIGDDDGDGLSFAQRAAEAGHQVRFWASTNAPTGDGFRGVEKVANWVSSVPWADMVFPTGNARFTERLDAFRERGVRVYGPTTQSATLERVPEAGRRLLNGSVPETPPEGVAFTVSRWVGTQGFLGKFNEGFPSTRLLAGDIGPETEGQGTVQRYVEESALGVEVLAPIEDALLAMGHLGLVTVRCVVDSEGNAWALGIVCRPAFPQFCVMQTEHKGDPVEWMLAACEGGDDLTMSEDTACGVVLSQPNQSVRIEGPDKALKYLHPRSVRVEATKLLTTGTSVGVLTGTGRNVRQATQRAYHTLEDIRVPDLMYRNDIGNLKDHITTLQAHGYATGWSF